VEGGRHGHRSSVGRQAMGRFVVESRRGKGMVKMSHARVSGAKSGRE